MTDAPKAPPPQIPDWSIMTLVVPGTLNVVRIVVAPRFSSKGGPEVIIVGDYVFRPNSNPINFKATVDIACASAGRAAAGFVKNGKMVGINPQAIFGVVDMVIEAVRRKCNSAIINPNGDRIVEMDEQGIIMGDIAQLLNMPSNGATDPVVASGPVMPPPEPPPQVEGQTTPMQRDPEIKLDF